MPDSNSRSSPQRRTPVQARSERRVGALLEAAAELLAEVGYDALTLTDVAERSGSGIGSLYHFFSNKEQLVDALVERVANSLRELPGLVFKPSRAGLPIELFVGGLTDTLAAFAERHPELPELMGRVIKLNPSIDNEIMQRLDAIMSERAPKLATSERLVVVRLTMEIVRSGVRLLAGSPKRTRPAVIRELKSVLTMYLGSFGR